MVIELLPPANAVPVQAPPWAMTRLAYYGMQVDGGMEVDQANCGTAVTVPPHQYVTDTISLWHATGVSPPVVTGQQVLDAPPGYRCSIKVTVTTAEASLAAGSALLFIHPFEGYRTARLLWGTALAAPLSLAFWVKSNVAPSLFSLCFRNVPTYDRFYMTNVPIYTANVWEYKTLTIPGPTSGTWGTTNGHGMDFLTVLAAGANWITTEPNMWSTVSKFAVSGISNYTATVGNTFQMTGLLMVPGTDLPMADNAPFIMRPFDEELQLCQRYYEKSYDYGTLPGAATTTGMCTCWANNTTLGELIRFTVMKRVAPTVTAYGTNGTAGVLANLTDGGTIASSPAYVGEGGYSEWSTACVVGKLYGWQWVANARV